MTQGENVNPYPRKKKSGRKQKKKKRKIPKSKSGRKKRKERKFPIRDRRKTEERCKKVVGLDDI